MKKKNYFVLKTGLLVVALATIGLCALAEDYYRVYKGSKTTLFPGSEIDSVKPVGTDLLFYRGSTADSIAMNDIDKIELDSGTIRRWDFNQDDAVPNDWTLTNPLFASISGGYINLSNGAWANYNLATQTGQYAWRVYIPQIGENERFGILGNLVFTGINPDYSYSIGIFYGTTANRNSASPRPTTNQLLLRCYADQPATSYFKAIDGDREYTLELHVALVNGKYYVSWLLDGTVVKEIQTNYTPAQTSFKILTGVGSNGAWQGSTARKQDYTAKFDYIEYTKD
jgi:hypothetical protein